LIKIDGLILADSLANPAFLFLKVKTAFINIGDQGNGLSEVDMDGFIERYILVILIRIFDRAVFYTRGTTRAFILENVPWLFYQRYLEVTYFPFYTVNFSISEDLDIGMPADLDQFGREYSHGAVIGRKGLVKLGHVPPNARRLLNQVHPKTGGSEIKRGLNTADPSADDHDIAKITVSKALTELLNSFSEYDYVSHFLSPHQVSSMPRSLPGESP
jgi:hypothetical protein